MERLSRSVLVLVLIGCGSGVGEPVANSSEAQAVKPGVVCSRKNVGAACDDGNPCTFNDRCTAALTCAGTRYSCDDQNPCTADACDGAGGCTHRFIGPDCDDGNPCTADACDGKGGCIHTPLFGTACDDGDACTANDTCQSGVCASGTAYRCETGNSCTVSACDGRGGCTAPVPLADGTPCNDGDFCTVGDTCQAGVCAGTRYSCDTGNACMVSTCDGSGGCSAPVPAFDGISCDDGNDCTDEWCRGGVCVSQPKREICNDGIDNDCNGLVDKDDPACDASCVPTQAYEDCYTPEDDDCNGFVNEDDWYCQSIDCNANPCGSGTICDGHYCVSSCHDGWRDSDESDVDCGGGCPHCENGKACWGSYDCISNNCVYAPGASLGVCMP
jgi:hypothetical protein